MNDQNIMHVWYVRSRLAPDEIIDYHSRLDVGLHNRTHTHSFHT